MLPGSWIDEMRLAEQYGISRTPLREALKVLAAEGLVTMKLRRGAYVTEVPVADLDKLFHLLALLESHAAASVARNATPAELDELEALNARLEQAVDDSAAFYTLNVQFDARLLELTGNPWQTQMVNDLRRLVRLALVGSLGKAEPHPGFAARAPDPAPDPACPGRRRRGRPGARPHARRPGGRAPPLFPMTPPTMPHPRSWAPTTCRCAASRCSCCPT